MVFYAFLVGFSMFVLRFLLGGSMVRSFLCFCFSPRELKKNQIYGFLLPNGLLISPADCWRSCWSLPCWSRKLVSLRDSMFEYVLPHLPPGFCATRHSTQNKNRCLCPCWCCFSISTDPLVYSPIFCSLCGTRLSRVYARVFSLDVLKEFPGCSMNFDGTGPWLYGSSTWAPIALLWLLLAGCACTILHLCCFWKEFPKVNQRLKGLKGLRIPLRSVKSGFKRKDVASGLCFFLMGISTLAEGSSSGYPAELVLWVGFFAPFIDHVGPNEVLPLDSQESNKLTWLTNF